MHNSSQCSFRSSSPKVGDVRYQGNNTNNWVRWPKDQYGGMYWHSTVRDTAAKCIKTRKKRTCQGYIPHDLTLSGFLQWCKPAWLTMEHSPPAARFLGGAIISTSAINGEIASNMLRSGGGDHRSSCGQLWRIIGLFIPLRGVHIPHVSSGSASTRNGCIDHCF